MTTLNAVSSFSGSGQTGLPPQTSIEGLARRGDGAELRAFIAERPDQADALRTELAKVNASALFELEPVVELPPITVTAPRAQAQDDNKGWFADRLDDLRGFVQNHDGSETIADAGDWVGGQIDRIRSDVPVVSQAASVTRGVLGFGKDLVQGVVSLPGMVVNGNIAAAQTGAALAEGRTTPGELIDQGVAVARAIPGAVAAPVTEAWRRGDYVEAVTRGATELATLPLLPAKAGAAVRVADGVVDGARVIDAASDAARAADAAGDVGRVADAGRTYALGGQALGLDDAARRYATTVNANEPWSWSRSLNGGDLTTTQRSEIKARAEQLGLVPDVALKPGTRYPDFDAAGLVIRADQLPESLWLASDSRQFTWLDNQIPGGRPDGTVWHHTETPGRMELVPFGAHASISHIGGRAPGHWAHAPR